MHSKEPYVHPEEHCEVCIGNIKVTYTSAKEPYLHSKEPYIPSEEPCEVCIGNIYVTYTSAKASRSASHPQSNFFLFSDLHGGALYSTKRALNVRKRVSHYRTSKLKRYTSTKQVFSDRLGRVLYLIKRALHKRALFICASKSKRYTSAKQVFFE